MRKQFISPATLKAVAEILSDIAENAIPVGCDCPDFFEDDDDWCDDFIPTPAQFEPCNCGCFGAPLPRWDVAGFPKEDKNKVFGFTCSVDEPRAQDYFSRAEFERDHAKFDRLVDAAEACTWQNKSNTATKHRVNAIRRPIHMGPPMNRNLVGETQWW